MILILPLFLRSRLLRPWHLPLLIRATTHNRLNTPNMRGNLQHLEQPRSLERLALRGRPPQCRFHRIRLSRVRSSGACGRKAVIAAPNTVLSASGSDALRLITNIPDALSCDSNGSLATLCWIPWRRSAFDKLEFNRKQSKRFHSTMRNSRRPRPQYI